MAQDIIDAEFISIRPDGTERPAARAIPVSAVTGLTQDRDDQIDLLVSPTQTEPPPGIRAHGAYAAAVAAVAFAAFYIAGGHVLFASAPANPAGTALSLERVSGGTKAALGVVTVSATVRNGSAAIARVPDILLTFEPAGGGRPLLYRVPRGETLAPGKSLAFTVRMPKKTGYDRAPSLKFDQGGV